MVSKINSKGKFMITKINSRVNELLSFLNQLSPREKTRFVNQIQQLEALKEVIRKSEEWERRKKERGER